MTPDATIVHYAGASSKRRADREMLMLKATGDAGPPLPARLAAAARRCSCSGSGR